MTTEMGDLVNYNNSYANGVMDLSLEELGSWNLSDNYSYYNYNYLPHNEEVSNEQLFYYYFWTYVTPTIFGIISLVGTIGNLLVVYVILSTPSMRTVTNYLLLNLAIADILFLIICVPFTAYKYVSFTWPFGEALCKVVKYLLYVTVYVTIYSLVIISALRFLTVVYNNATIKLRTKTNTIICIILIWMIVLGVNIPVLFVHKVNTFGEFSYCGLEKESVGPLFVTFFVFGYLFPLLLICLLYLIIMCHLEKAKSKTTVTSVKAKGRTAHVYRLVCLVILVFGISWLPIHVNSLISKYGTTPQGPVYEVFRVLFNCMAYGNSCANPIIYNYFSKDFKSCFQKVMCSCCKAKTCSPSLIAVRHSSLKTTANPTEMVAMV